MESDLNVLIIEPDRSVASELEKRLKNLNIRHYLTSSHGEPIHRMKSLMPDLTILGSSLDEETCLKCIHKLKIIDPSAPILTSNINCLPGEPSYAPFEGVHYLDPHSEENVILNSIEAALNHRTEKGARVDYPVIIGRSLEIRAIRQKMWKVADKDITVLITGETGTGKELVARFIHFYSPRNRGPLVKVDCTSLPDDLLESEVFGYQKGAFTDAYRDKPGRLELADGGTLFIDEIGDLSLPMQAKFLQVFEEKGFSRLGGTEDRLIDARVVAATNNDLSKKMAENRFRKDLFYRLSFMRIHVPPLRERKDDIPLIMDYFINKYCYELNKEPLTVPKKIFDLLMGYKWPGNIREMENTIRRAIAISDWDFTLRELITDDIEEADPDDQKPKDDELIDLFKKNDFSLKKISKEYVDKAEIRAIMNALNKTGWNRKKASQMLGVSYKTLINRIEEFGLKP